MELTNKEWKFFSLKNLFSVERGTRLIIRDRVDGKYPFATAGFTNQGVVEYISNDSNKTFKDSITIDMFGNTFFRFYEFKCDDNIHVLQSSNLSLYAIKFIKTSISKSISDIYSYGKQFRLKSFYLLKIPLPVNSKGEPDYAFMEDYIRQKETELLQQYKKQVLVFESVVPLSEKEWKEFFIEDIFNIKSGKRLTKAEMVSGDIPFVGATDSNNGITGFVANKNSSMDKNVLGVNYNGSVVYNFYHPYEAVFSDDVKRLSFKEFEGSKYSFLFVKALIMQQKSKYEYGYKFNGERMKRQIILLPVNHKGKPDYAYMENYMKVLENEKITQYLGL